MYVYVCVCIYIYIYIYIYTAPDLVLAKLLFKPVFYPEESFFTDTGIVCRFFCSI